MSEFVELEECWWVLRSEIVGVRMFEATYTYGFDKHRVDIALRGQTDVLMVCFDSLDEAKAAVRKIRGVVPPECTEWADSKIVCPSLSINFRTQDSPILWGRWHDGGEAPFRVTRGSDGIAKCVGMPPVNAPWPMPDFWRHLPAEEKIEILDRIHKAKNEGASDEEHF